MSPRKKKSRCGVGESQSEDGSRKVPSRKDWCKVRGVPRSIDKEGKGGKLEAVYAGRKGRMSAQGVHTARRKGRLKKVTAELMGDEILIMQVLEGLVKKRLAQKRKTILCQPGGNSQGGATQWGGLKGWGGCLPELWGCSSKKGATTRGNLDVGGGLSQGEVR